MKFVVAVKLSYPDGTRIEPNKVEAPDKEQAISGLKKVLDAIVLSRGGTYEILTIVEDRGNEPV